MYTVLDYSSITTPTVMDNTFPFFRPYILAYNLFNDTSNT